MRLDFDPESAANADRGGIIKDSGVYVGVFKNVEVFQSDSSMSQGLQFDFESDSGESAKYMKIYTKKKDGSRSFGFDMVNSFLGLKNIKSVNVEADGDRQVIKDLCEKKIAVALQYEEYYKNDGGIGFKMNILHFLDPVTMQTYSEKKDGLEAKVCKHEIKPKLVSNSKSSDGQNSFKAKEDDLPF